MKIETFQHRRLLWFFPLALSLFGVLTIASVTSMGGLGGQISLYSTGGKQVAALLSGLFLMLICSSIPLSWWKKYSAFIWFAAIALVVATLIPGIGVRAGGARRWLNFGPLAFQPLELLTFAVPVHLAKCLASSDGKEGVVFWRITCIIALSSVAGLLLQPNLGGTILVVALCFAIHVENRGWLYPSMFGAVLAVFALPFIFLVEYRMRRVLSFMNPWADPLDTGFQAIQGRIAFANGGIFGMGIGNGLQKLHYLPAAHTDYIFSAIGEEFGILGTLGVLFVFFAWFLTVWGLYKAQRDPFKSALAFGLAASVLFPMFINLAGVMSLMPLTGIPLPFVSSGGSAMLLMWAKIGLLIRIAKEAV